MELKGLLLAGGTGSRLRPLTYTGAKQLIPVANRPILFYAVEAMVDAGVTDIGVIVGETGPAVRAALGDGSRFGCRFTYLPQSAPLGLAHAVKTAEPFLGDAPFLMMLGDNLLRGGLKTLVERFARGQFSATILLTAVPDPRPFGVAVVENGRVVRLLEKPDPPPSNLALVGAYCFAPVIHAAIRTLRPSWRGELEITDAIQTLIDWNLPVDAAEVEGWWKDTGRPEDVLEANRLVLEDLVPYCDPTAEVSPDSTLTGRVHLGPRVRVVRSHLRGPVIVGEGAELVDAYVGPYTAIGPRVVVRTAEVEHSVILQDSHLVDLALRVDQSLIGQGVVVAGGPRRPRALRLVLGDHSRIDL
ncbi:MAG: glucose-1-phosphate thymidylyltransferase [Firmicutes bacterium]|nr:glucose-1-phosphate thymidylyltransferase [Alicyclobacillaceae bacterium]MCL6497110.1 glucose-1-phosphate thymidylyltransferase [Bacillota bacterium]